MKVKKMPSDVEITFSSSEYCLMKCDDNTLGDYELHYLIDRSYKGKDPDIGMQKMYLDENEAKLFIESGFMIVE